MTNESVSLVGTAVALILPWLFGITFVSCLLTRSPRWNCWMLAGHGYLAGMILSTLVLRLWDCSGLTLHFWGLAASIFVSTFAGLALLRTQPGVTAEKVQSHAMETWQRLLLATLLLAIAFRYYGIMREILLRPLYPWDAWMNWAPKAITWHELGYLVDYISPDMWLRQFGDSLTYTTGATNAWKYPVTIPLIQLWGMLGAGSADQNFSNLPWLFAPIAFGLALYGHLKLYGASTVLAALACYVFLSIPNLNVHTALAGYADIWLAVYFGAATMALHEWQRSRHWSWALLSLFFAFSCTQLKLPGLVLGAILVTVFLVTLINLPLKAKLIIAAMLSIFVLYSAMLGVSFDLPWLGPVKISSGEVVLPYLGIFEIVYHPVHGALVDSIFYMRTWNMLWYVFLFVLIAKLFFREFLLPPSIELQSILLLLLFLLFTFYFTHVSDFVLDRTTVNRALLYATPAIVFYLFNSIRSWASSASKMRHLSLKEQSGIQSRTPKKSPLFSHASKTEISC